jgi:cell division protein FtsW
MAMRAATTILVFCVTALLALGMVMLYSSSMADPSGAHDFVMQLAWCGLGLGAGLVGATMDYRLLKKFAWPLYGLAVILLVLVLVPHIGSKMNGARRWFRLPVGGIRFQPSELGKMALIVALAWYGDHCQRRMSDWKRGMLIPGLFIMVILGLIFVEPDRGTTILMGGVTGAMLLIAGARWRHLVPPLLVGVLLISASILHDPVRRERVFAWMHPEEQKMGTGLQADRAKLALGSGGWTGVGLGNSRQKLGYLPFHNTDFILPIIGEELGLVATLGVVMAFGLVVICGLHISSRSSDTFGTLLGSGITLMIGLQAAINVGVVTDVLPNKGIPLPFISYGGSNLLIMLTSVGLLVGIARRARVAPAARLDPGEMPSPQLP